MNNLNKKVINWVKKQPNEIKERVFRKEIKPIHFLMTKEDFFNEKATISPKAQYRTLGEINKLIPKGDRFEKVMEPLNKTILEKANIVNNYSGKRESLFKKENIFKKASDKIIDGNEFNRLRDEIIKDYIRNLIIKRDKDGIKERDFKKKLKETKDGYLLKDLNDLKELDEEIRSKHIYLTSERKNKKFEIYALLKRIGDGNRINSNKAKKLKQELITGETHGHQTNLLLSNPKLLNAIVNNTSFISNTQAVIILKKLQDDLRDGKKWTNPSLEVLLNLDLFEKLDNRTSRNALEVKNQINKIRTNVDSKNVTLSSASDALDDLTGRKNQITNLVRNPEKKEDEWIKFNTRNLNVSELKGDIKTLNDKYLVVDKTVYSSPEQLLLMELQNSQPFQKYLSQLQDVTKKPLDSRIIYNNKDSIINSIEALKENILLKNQLGKNQQVENFIKQLNGYKSFLVGLKDKDFSNLDPTNKRQIKKEIQKHITDIEKKAIREINLVIGGGLISELKNTKERVFVLPAGKSKEVKKLVDDLISKGTHLNNKLNDEVLELKSENKNDAKKMTRKKLEEELEKMIPDSNINIVRLTAKLGNRTDSSVDRLKCSIYNLIKKSKGSTIPFLNKLLDPNLNELMIESEIEAMNKLLGVDKENQTKKNNKNFTKQPLDYMSFVKPDKKEQVLDFNKQVKKVTIDERQLVVTNVDHLGLRAIDKKGLNRDLLSAINYAKVMEFLDPDKSNDMNVITTNLGANFIKLVEKANRHCDKIQKALTKVEDKVKKEKGILRLHLLFVAKQLAVCPWRGDTGNPTLDQIKVLFELQFRSILKEGGVDRNKKFHKLSLTQIHALMVITNKLKILFDKSKVPIRENSPQKTKDRVKKQVELEEKESEVASFSRNIPFVKLSPFKLNSEKANEEIKNRKLKAEKELTFLRTLGKKVVKEVNKRLEKSNFSGNLNKHLSILEGIEKELRTESDWDKVKKLKLLKETLRNFILDPKANKGQLTESNIKDYLSPYQNPTLTELEKQKESEDKNKREALSKLGIRILGSLKNIEGVYTNRLRKLLSEEGQDFRTFIYNIDVILNSKHTKFDDGRVRDDFDTLKIKFNDYNPSPKESDHEKLRQRRNFVFNVTNIVSGFKNLLKDLKDWKYLTNEDINSLQSEDPKDNLVKLNTILSLNQKWNDENTSFKKHLKEVLDTTSAIFQDKGKEITTTYKDAINPIRQELKRNFDKIDFDDPKNSLTSDINFEKYADLASKLTNSDNRSQYIDRDGYDPVDPSITRDVTKHTQELNSDLKIGTSLKHKASFENILPEKSKPKTKSKDKDINEINKNSDKDDYSITLKEDFEVKEIDKEIEEAKSPEEINKLQEKRNKTITRQTKDRLR